MERQDFIDYVNQRNPQHINDADIRFIQWYIKTCKDEDVTYDRVRFSMEISLTRAGMAITNAIKHTLNFFEINSIYTADITQGGKLIKYF